MKETTAAAAAEVIRSVGVHFYKVFFTHDRFYDKAQIFGDRITKAFTDNLTGILDRELDLEVLVPIGIGFQFSFADPLGIVFVNIFYDKVMLDVEFFQSCQD